VRKALLATITLALAALACSSTSTSPKTTVPVVTLPAPTLAAPPPRPTTEQASLIPVATERFDAGVEGWYGWAEEGALSEIAQDSTGQLLWSVELATEKAAALIHEWPALAEADGLTIRLTSLDRSAMLVMGVQEADESNYNLMLPLSAGETVEYTIPFTGFGLDVNGKDENGQLDVEQIVFLSLVDISGFLAAPRPNRVTIEEIVLWKGTVALFDLSCGASVVTPSNTDFRTGVDANFIPQGEKTRHGFWVGDQRVDPVELLAANGADAFRVRLWVGEKGESKLAYATDLARRAQELGMHPYLVLFLSEDWTDVNKQPAPAAWADLPINERADAIRDYARETAQHFIDQGIDLDFYEVGNEIDYGICGIFADTTHPRDVASLQAEIWPDEACLIQAAIDGVREADPDARFLLHIATSWDPAFAVEFFRTMTDSGVTYDYVGLSYYPSAFGKATADRFCVTLNRLNTEIGKPIIIAETAYPAEPPTDGMFGDWRRPLPGYPMSPEGQAWWLKDLLAGMRTRDDVIGIYYFSPEFWFSGELWSPFALFDSDGKARPAIASFNTGR
jgi:arabinogalactan endo-1,4-beta-galactosidase